MLRIGNTILKNNLLLAPVAGHCDLPFRLAARSCGSVGLAFTDLLCPHGILKQNSQTQWLMATNPDDHPLGMQLYGQDLDLMADAARWAVDHGATLIDINMGCPVDKVTKTFAGAMMLCTPDHTLQVAERLVNTVGHQVPVTAKTRLGYHAGECTAPDLARRLIHVGIQCLTIHGRTAAQRFKGHADLTGIARVVDAVHAAGNNQIPCIGNGDIRTPFDAQQMIAATNCDGVMIARAALAAPWIFRDTQSLLTTGSIQNELTLRQRLDVIRRHFHHMLDLRDPRRALARIRQCISGYGKHLGACKTLKQAIRTLEDPTQFDPILDAFLDFKAQAADHVPVTWADRRRALAQPVAA